MKGGAEPTFILNHPAAAALSAEPKAEGPAAKPPGEIALGVAVEMAKK